MNSSEIMHQYMSDFHGLCVLLGPAFLACVVLDVIGDDESQLLEITILIDPNCRHGRITKGKM